MKKIIALFLCLILYLPTYAQSSSDKLVRQGISYHDQGRYQEAISCFQQALRINPSSMSAVYEMSLSYLKMGDYDNAIKYSAQVVNVGFKPLLVDAYVVNGTALAAQNKLNEAVSLFNGAIEQCGGEYLLYYNLGLTYYNKKETEKAIINLKKAIEIDTTHPGAFLLYAYTMNDVGNWIQSFYSFHFFLLLEPNTKRSMDAFNEMYNLLSTKMEASDPRLQSKDGIDRLKIYSFVEQKRPLSADKASQYTFFTEASKTIFKELEGVKPTDNNKDVFWTFFVPIFNEILESGHFDTYCRYVSVSYFSESFEWWEKNKLEVDDFIEWFEHGETISEHDEEIEGEGEVYEEEYE